MKRSNSAETQGNSKRRKLDDNDSRLGNYEINRLTLSRNGFDLESGESTLYVPGEIVKIIEIKPLGKDRIAGKLENQTWITIQKAKDEKKICSAKKTQKPLSESKPNCIEARIAQAIFKNDTTSLQKILFENKVDVNVNKKCEIYDFPLHYACKKGKLAIIEMLLANNADLHKQNIKGMTSLHMASYKGHLPVVKKLVELNANVQAKTKTHGQTPFIFASKEGNLEVVNFLGEHGANVNTKTKKYGKTALHIASHKGHLPVVVELIFNLDANVNCRSNSGCSPLFYAAESGHLEICDFLIQNNASLNLKDHSENTCLYEAVNHDQFQITKLLLQNNANVNNSKDLPLMSSIIRSNHQITNLLLDYGADPNAKGPLNVHTAFSLISVSGSIKVGALLFAHGADPSLTILHREYEAIDLAFESEFYHFLLYFIEHDSGTANWFKTKPPTSAETLAAVFGGTSKRQRVKQLIFGHISYLKQIQNAIYTNFSRIPGLAKILDEYTHGLQNLLIFEEDDAP